MHSRLILAVLVPVLALGGCRASPSRTGDAAAAFNGWTDIGRSGLGRPIQAATRGRGPVRVYIIGGIHGDEPEGLAEIDSLAITLGGHSAASIATTRILRDANPDGTAAGTRGNSRGRDLNRNWPATNFLARNRNGESALSEPEAGAVHDDLLRFNPDLVIVFHSTRAGPFVNYDGPALEYAQAFAAAASSAEPRWRIVPDMGYPTPGSLGSFIGIDRGTPILTIEFRRGQSAESALASASAGVMAVLRRSSGLVPRTGSVAAAGTSATATATPSARTGRTSATPR